MGYRTRNEVPCHDLNKNECCSLPFAIENCHIFFEGQCENTFNMSAAVLVDVGNVKVRNYFLANNTRGVSPYKFRRNRLRCDHTCAVCASVARTNLCDRCRVQTDRRRKLWTRTKSAGIDEDRQQWLPARETPAGTIKNCRQWLPAQTACQSHDRRKALRETQLRKDTIAGRQNCGKAKKNSANHHLRRFAEFACRDERIRTFDLHVPNVAR